MKSRFLRVLPLFLLIVPILACRVTPDLLGRPSVQFMPAGPAVTREQVAQARVILERRLESGLEGRVTVRIAGDLLTVQVQSEEQIPAAIELASAPGQAVFFASLDFIEAGTLAPAGLEVVLTDSDLAGAEPAYYAVSGLYELVSFTLTPAGTRKLAVFSQDSLGDYLVFALDDIVVYSLMVVTPILDGKVALTGGLDEAAAKRLAAILNSGRLPYPLQVVEP